MFKKNRKLIYLLIAFAIAMSGCSLPGLGGSDKNSVVIGTLDTSESQIMGNIVKYQIEHYTDLKVTLVNNLGSSVVQHQAMTSGDVDITATRYTGTDLSGVLGLEPVSDPEKALEIVQREFQDKFEQTWFDSYGFATSYAFSVKSEFAKEKNLQTVSDLEEIAPDLKFGVDNSWLKRKGDGYPGFVEKYGFEFGETFPMQLGLVYQAVANNKMDVVLAYTTDGRIQAFDLKVLEDDKEFFPAYDASLVARNEILEKHPELKEILQKLSGKIDTEKMQELNYEADGKLKEPTIIAKDYLNNENFYE